MSKWAVIASILMLTLGVFSAPAQVPSSPGSLSMSASTQRIHSDMTASDIKASALWDGRKEVAFHSVSFPKMVKASEARFLIDDEYVLGITENGESRAYPSRFASWHHIINDRIGKKDQGGAKYITVTYCIVCNSGMRFDTPIINDKPLVFDFYGLYNGVMTMYDKSTKSVWLQVAGRAVKGPLLGTALKQGPVTDTTWRQWKRLHPNTLVMAPDPIGKGGYEPTGSIMVRGYTSFPTSYFKRTITHRDSRLAMFEPIVACNVPLSAVPSNTTGAESTAFIHRAYPLKIFKGKTGVINDLIERSPIAVFFLAGSETAVAVSRMLDDTCLSMETRKDQTGKIAFFDKETGTRWNIEGLAEEGPLAGRSLNRIDSHMSQWYGWVSYFPETTIYGQNSIHRVPHGSTSGRQLLASRHKQ